MELTFRRDQACDVDGCDRPSRARGMCARHYDRWRKYGDPGDGVIRFKASKQFRCKACGMCRSHSVWISGGLCPSCYGIVRRGGELTVNTAATCPMCDAQPQGVMLCAVCGTPLRDHRIGQCRVDLGRVPA